MSVIVDRAGLADSVKYFLNLHSGAVAFRTGSDNTMYDLNTGRPCLLTHENWEPLKHGDKVQITLEV